MFQPVKKSTNLETNKCDNFFTVTLILSIATMICKGFLPIEAFFSLLFFLSFVGL
jgi:hypothetical protein